MLLIQRDAEGWWLDNLSLFQTCTLVKLPHFVISPLYNNDVIIHNDDQAHNNMMFSGLPRIILCCIKGTSRLAIGNEV